jgi:hypothetical protein
MDTMIKKQTVYIPTNNDEDLAVCYFSSFEEWTHKETVKETEGYFFTLEELKSLLEEYTNRIVENATAETKYELNGDEYGIVNKKSIQEQLPLMLKELGI